MSSDDTVAARVSPSYEVAWEDLFQNGIKLLLSDGVSVATWNHNHNEIAVIRGKDSVLAVAPSANSDATWQHRQKVVVDSKNASDIISRT